MTQFQQDVVKIVIDKGLLVLVAGGLGSFFSWLLEGYKARTAYRSKLTERRLDAYEKTGLILQTLLLKTHHLVQVIERGFGEDAEAAQQEMDIAYKALAENYHQEMATAMTYGNLYMPPEIYGSFSKFQLSITRFTLVLDDPHSGEEGRKKLRSIADGMIEHLTNLQIAIKKEIDSGLPHEWWTRDADRIMPVGRSVCHGTSEVHAGVQALGSQVGQ